MTPIKLSPQDVSGLGQSFATSSQSCQDIMTRITAQMNALKPYWEGLGATEAADYYTSALPNLLGFVTRMATVGRSLLGFSGAMKVLDESHLAEPVSPEAETGSSPAEVPFEIKQKFPHLFYDAENSEVYEDGWMGHSDHYILTEEMIRLEHEAFYPRTLEELERYDQNFTPGPEHEQWPDGWLGNSVNYYTTERQSDMEFSYANQLDKPSTGDSAPVIKDPSKSTGTGDAGDSGSTYTDSWMSNYPESTGSSESSSGSESTGETSVPTSSAPSTPTVTTGYGNYY